MRIVCFSDTHLEAGYGLGNSDPDWENTRMLDAKDVLARICVERADLLVFLGDLAAGPTPRPLALSIFQEALALSTAEQIFLMEGNHDHIVTRRSALLVVAEGGATTGGRCTVVEGPMAFGHEPAQLCFLPWTPTSRLLTAGMGKEGMNRSASAVLVDIARGLRQQLPPGLPTILFAHWLLAGSNMPSGGDIMKVSEPVLDAEALEACGFDLVIAGHNHLRQQIGPKSYVCGTTMRDSWGEENLEPGYVVIDVEVGQEPVVAFRPSHDRRLVTIRRGPELVADWLDGRGDIGDMADLTERGCYEGAIVRVLLETTEDRLSSVVEKLPRIRDELVFEGAHKVIVPNPTVTRARQRRSEVKVETDPMNALEQWMDQEQIEARRREGVVKLAQEVMDGG